MPGSPKRRREREAMGLPVAPTNPSPAKGSGHGGPARDYSWPTAESGNQLALVHGGYSSLRAGERAEEILAELLAVAPVVEPADLPMFRLLSAALERFENATLALARIDETAGTVLGPYMSEQAQALDRLRADQARWIEKARRLAESLALSPTSRAKLGLDILRAEDTLDQLRERGREIRERRGET